MKKRIKKYISGCIVASLLLSTIPLYTVHGAEVDSKSEKEQELSSNENGSTETISDGMDDGNDVIVEEVSESSNVIESAVSKDTVSDDQEGADGILDNNTLIENENDKVNDAHTPECLMEDHVDPDLEPKARDTLQSTNGFKKKYYLGDLLEHSGETLLNIPQSGRLRFVFEECEYPDFNVSCWHKRYIIRIRFITTD